MGFSWSEIMDVKDGGRMCSIRRICVMLEGDVWGHPAVRATNLVGYSEVWLVRAVLGHGFIVCDAWKRCFCVILGFWTRCDRWVEAFGFIRTLVTAMSLAPCGFDGTELPIDLSRAPVAPYVCVQVFDKSFYEHHYILACSKGHLQIQLLAVSLAILTAVGIQESEFNSPA